MFSLDKWQEIFSTMARNPLRVALTAFSVSWGIFMLIILMGFVSGLQNGVQKDFKDDATNSLWVNAGKTSIAYKGYKPGRRIQLTNEDLAYTTENVEGLDNVAARKDFWGMSNEISWGENSASISIVGCDVNYKFVESLTTIQGRFLNREDMVNARKVVALGRIARDLLFPKGYNPVGEYININGLMFKVIGVYEDPGGDRDMNRLYMPYTTSQQVYNDPDKIDRIILLTNSDELAPSKEIEAKVTKMMQERHNVSPKDVRAIRIYNNVERFMQFQSMFKVIRAFLWVVAILTIIIGIIGVGNIMLITVKERTKEIGIRKALGATPFSIVSMILQEAVLITVVAGYSGLLAGFGLIQLIASMIPETPPASGHGGGGMSFLGQPEVDMGTAIAATVILIVSGTLAGLLPALKASWINPITAIRDE